MRCPQEVNRKNSSVISVCYKNMNLVHSLGYNLDSEYFNELFARYQDRLIFESKKSWAIDSPDEVYSILSSCFTKIVAQFARKKEFKSRTDKWFSSFFWSSIQNRIADLQKTRNYLKRTPPIQCQISGKILGQITSRHLYKEARKEITDKIVERMGRRILEDSGELSCCFSIPESDEKIEKRSLMIGYNKFNSYSEKRRKEIFNLECIEIYMSMFPGCLIKNHVLSIHHPLSSDDNSEVEAVANIDVLSSPSDPIADFETRDLVSALSDVVFEEIGDEPDLFSSEITDDQKRETILLIIEKKISYDNEEDDDGLYCNMAIDLELEKTKVGATSFIIDFIRKSLRCREIMGLISTEECAKTGAI